MLAVLKQAPEYALAYVVGLIAVALTDTIVTTLLIGCVLLGFLTTPLIAATTFFLAYAVFGAITNVALTIHHTGHRIAQALASLRQPPPIV